jgi:CRP/FNR family cyclic AMP-dependent transcriptional regulator
MAVSLEAIFLSIFVLVSQNRQAAKDRIKADLDYQVDVKAEIEMSTIVVQIRDMQHKMHHMHCDILDVKQQQEQSIGGK